MGEELARVPKVGEVLHFWDDGKSGDSRHYLAVVTHVLTKEQMKRVSWTPAECLEHWEDEHGEWHDIPKDFIELWEYNKNQCPWLFADDTDFFVAAAVPEYDEHILWFVRKKDGGWFSMDVQSCWQGGFLDVTGEKYKNNIEAGYTYSERI